MITNKMIYEHKKKYPTFNAQSFIEWIDKENIRHWYNSVAKANKLFRRYKSMDKLCQKE